MSRLQKISEFEASTDDVERRSYKAKVDTMCAQWSTGWFDLTLFVKEAEVGRSRARIGFGA